jgi:hypothetical protein
LVYGHVRALQDLYPAIVQSLGNKQEEANKQHCGTDGGGVERPVPVDAFVDVSTNYRCEVAAGDLDYHVDSQVESSFVLIE